MTQNIKKLVKISSFTIFFIIIIVYAFFTSRNLIFGVKITGVNVVDGSTIKDSAMQVTGNAKNAVNISLNGREISIDKNGNFKEDVALLSGYNVINIKAVDKFGNRDEKNYKLIYKQ